MRLLDSLARGVAIAVVATCAAAAVALVAPTAGAQTSGYVTTSDNARLFYRIIGRGTDTLIAIHGGPGMDLESIYGDFTALGARHVVIFYYQRGGGKSELPADTMRLVAARQIQDLDELRQHFKLAKVTLVADAEHAAPGGARRDGNHSHGHGGGLGNVDAERHAPEDAERGALHVR